MKKKIIIWIVAGILIFLLAALVLFDLNKEDSKSQELTKVTVAEVTHSIFYAPQYVAIDKGFFEEVGIDIERIRKVDSIMIEKILDSTEQISKNNNYLLKHWVGKEAYVKYIGIGIIEDFNKLNLKQLQKHNNHLMKVTNRYIVCAYAKEKISKKIIYLDENDMC